MTHARFPPFFFFFFFPGGNAQEGGLRVRVLIGDYRHVSSLVDTDDARVLLLDCYIDVKSPQHVISLPPAFASAFVYVPWNGGHGEFGASRVRVSALQLGHVTGQVRPPTIRCR